MIEIILGTLAVAASLINYYLGRRAGRRLARLERVVSEYVKLADSGRDSGPHALLTAGIRSLRTDGEYREVFTMIADRLGRHPLGARAAHLEQVDMKRLFDELEMDSPTISNYDEVFERFRDR